MKKHLLYITDPMCSWCYGFGASLGALLESHPGELSLRVIAGGLRPFTQTPMPASEASEILHHWQRVQQVSGRPFDFSFFEKHPGFIYDTAPADTAVQLVRELAAEKVFAFIEALQSAFYQHGEDPTRLSTLVAAVRAAGIDAALFEARFPAALQQRTILADFEFARALGVRGFPALFVHETDGEDVAGWRPVAQGYCDLEQLEARLFT